MKFLSHPAHRFYIFKFPELNDNLQFPDGTKFYPDVKNGVRGYNTEAARGADTFHPFSGFKGEATILRSDTNNPSNAITINNARQYKAIFASFSLFTTGTYKFNDSTGAIKLCEWGDNLSGNSQTLRTNNAVFIPTNDTVTISCYNQKMLYVCGVK